MSKTPFKKQRLFCPGPTPVPDVAVAAGMNASTYHRTDSFYKDLLQCRELLCPLFGTSSQPLILTASGTGALEAAVTNLTNPGDEVIVIVGGKFGERWKKIGEAFNLKVYPIDIEWGTPASPETLGQILKSKPDTKAVFFQANETSTGVHYDVERLTATVRNHSKALTIVDAVSSIGAHPMKMDDWQVDCVVSGSQKGFGIPPGLSFISLSEKAWSSLSNRSRFYFDLKAEYESQVKGATLWTPATTIIAALKSTLELFHEYTLEAVYEHHKVAALAVRAGAEAIGLELLTDTHFSHAVTAIRVPDNLDGLKILKILRETYGAIFAGGQDRLKGKILRFGHLGFFDKLDLIAGMGALEMSLKDCGYEFDFGAGTAALMRRLQGC